MLSEEHLSDLRSGDALAWAALDWRVPFYVAFTTTFAEHMPVWQREIMADGVAFRRPQAYGKSEMINQYCRGYAMALQAVLDQAYPQWPVEAVIREGTRGDYVLIRTTQPERVTNYDEISEITGQKPLMWRPLTDTWTEWELSIEDQAALSFAIRASLGECSDEVSGWPCNGGTTQTATVHDLNPGPGVAVAPVEALQDALEDGQAADECADTGSADGFELNATQLAQEVGIGVRNMQRYLAGHRAMPIEVLNLIVAARPDLDPTSLIRFLAEKKITSADPEGEAAIN